MVLAPQEARLFFKLYSTLLCFVNQRLSLLPGRFARGEEYTSLPPKDLLKVRRALLDDIDVIELFVDQPPADFSQDEVEIVYSWRHSVSGEFYIFRYLRNFTVFLATDKEPLAYGVTALTQPLDQIVGPVLPILTRTILLPFKGKIVYDGLLDSYNVSFGPGIRQSLNEEYREAKQRRGIITTLPVGAARPFASTAKRLGAGAKRSKAAASPKDAKEVLKPIIELTDQFCGDYLNDEYAELCHKLAESLARKRPSPLIAGKPSAWACGIVRTIGWVNFLDDASLTPHMRMTEIDKAFKVGQSTGQGKSKQIRHLLRIAPFEPQWTLPSRLEDNPLIWIVTVNGLPMDIRNCPRAAQEIAYQKGLIPYIPADREKASEQQR